MIKVGYRYHMGVTPRYFRFRIEDAAKFHNLTVEELEQQLMKYEAEGYKFIPFEGCHNFDKTGACLGHKI